MSAKRLILALLLLVALSVALAACMAGQGPGSPSPTPSLTPGGPPGAPTSPQAATTPSPSDLTNQFSPLAATFASGSSATPLSGQGPSIGVKRIADGLSAPLMLTGAPDITNRLFVVDQVGTLRIIAPDGTLSGRPFLDLRDRMVSLSPAYDERGLLGLAFHPHFDTNGRFFVFYSAPLRSGAPAGWSCTNRLSEFRVSATDPNVADPASEHILLEVDKPAMNHNGGQIRFGPDGYLYVPLGDGGGADDTGTGHTPGIGNAQDMTKLLGKVLRIDVDHTTTGKEYGIPADNPYVYQKDIAPEIYASGFRNPAYASFDFYVSRQYIVASAGQALFESAYIVLPGGNYGWNIREGTHCFDPAHDSAPAAGPCATTGSGREPLIGPVVELGHDLGNTIVGGSIYRGIDNPRLTALYVFGTWTERGFTGTGDGSLLVATPPEGWDIGRYPHSVSQLTPYDNRMWSVSEIAVSNTKNGRLNAYIRGFGEDNRHEIYILASGVPGPDPGSSTGMVLKIVPTASLPVGATGY